MSIFNGPEPQILRSASETAELEAVATWLRWAASDGIAPSEVGVFVRSRLQLDRARAAVVAAGYESFDLSERDEAPSGRVAMGTIQVPSTWLPAGLRDAAEPGRRAG